MLNDLQNYLQSINASEEVRHWLSTTGKKALSEQKTNVAEIEHVIDYLVSDKAPKRLRKMSFKDAERKAAAWSKANQKRGRGLIDTKDDIELVHDFFDGTKIVKLKTKKALQREGTLMSHCVGGYDANDPSLSIYSYRDAKNMPHVTFEVRHDGSKITQIKGKGNGSIHPRYIHPVLEFLKTVGMDIKPGDMKNLGYYHVTKEQIDLLMPYGVVVDKFKVISGESYVVE